MLIRPFLAPLRLCGSCIRRLFQQAPPGQYQRDIKANAAISEQRQNVSGLKLVYEPKYLRFFQARFEPTEGTSVFEARIVEEALVG